MAIKVTTPSFHSNKVVCINDDQWMCPRTFLWGLFSWTQKCKGPKKDDIVTVLGDFHSAGEWYYVLKEWSEDNDEGYLASCFAPIEDKFDAITTEKVVEQENKLISVN